MADLAAQPTSIQSIYNLYRENKLFVNRRYQRKLVWTLEEKRRLIESIVCKYPIPAILIAETDQAGTFEIIDGLQRLHAIVSYIEQSFEGIDGRYFDLNMFPTALAYAQAGLFFAQESVNLIDRKQVSTILDYSLSLSVMRNATESEINDVFSRINTYGHRLSDQERRQAGIRNPFSTMVRQIACTMRGDVSADIVLLAKMPSISIDLPKTKHGYEVKADKVFWVEQGVLRSTDLRDSMDEQYIADIAACVITGEIIERSKDSLDAIYDDKNEESARISDALELYGSEKFNDKFTYCIQEILNVCNAGKSEKLRKILFDNQTTNAFPSVFAVLFMAFYQLLIQEKKVISNYADTKSKLAAARKRIDTGRGATTITERQANVKAIVGQISEHFIPRTSDFSEIYANHTTIDIDALLRRSEIELPDYELKQGLLILDKKRAQDKNIISKVCKTICAIANNGQKRLGKVIIGVANDEADAEKIRALDKIEYKTVGRRCVVGIQREAKILNISLEDYYSIWKDGIRNSQLSEPLKSSVMSSTDFNNYNNLGIIIITINPQSEMSFYGDDVYWRNGDSTELAVGAKKIAEIASRFR